MKIIVTPVSSKMAQLKFVAENGETAIVDVPSTAEIRYTSLTSRVPADETPINTAPPITDHTVTLTDDQVLSRSFNDELMDVMLKPTSNRQPKLSKKQDELTRHMLLSGATGVQLCEKTGMSYPRACRYVKEFAAKRKWYAVK